MNFKRLILFLCLFFSFLSLGDCEQVDVVDQARQRLLSHRMRTDLINYLIAKNQYKTYLEVGAGHGYNFHSVHIEHKDGVDTGGSVANYLMTSDAFFEKNEKTYDIIFIDAMHLCEQTLRDVENSLNCLNEGGVIVMHDCLPQCYEHQVPYVVDGAWNGDVWKAAAHIRMNVSDVHFCVLDMDWGCGILTPNCSQVLYPAVPFNELDWNFYVRHRIQLLNVMRVEDWVDLD